MKIGELGFPLPVGYTYDINGKTVMDPNEEAQTAVQHVFRAFRVSASAVFVNRKVDHLANQIVDQPG